MILLLNGKETEIAGESITVTALLKEADVEMPEYVSVQVGDEIVPRDEFDTKTVLGGQSVEFLYYMGGGQAV